MVDYPDIINYSREELVEEFCKLFDRCQDLHESNEADTQKIHELKRALDTATAAQSYLSQELEQYTNTDANPEASELHKTQTDLVELKKKYGKLHLSFTALQQDYSTLMKENSSISQNLEEALKHRANIPLVVDYKISEEDLLRIQILENENMDLLEKVADFEELNVRYTLTIAECEKNIEILRDQITCLEENLQSKKMDLEEKLQILESTQEQLAEANAKIAMLSSAPENNDRKGNSLFAEVDDQRQAMKQLLTAQKKSYLQMKKTYNESEHEIRRLKRENISMHTELEACSSIFCNADKFYQEKLNARVHHLLNQNEDLERKLRWTQDKLKELASGKGVVWLDSMLNFCKNETDDLKKHLNRVRMQKASLEEQLRNAQQDMARWRFESLKSRCILLDREHLLVENNISFKPVQAIEFHISEQEQNEARPRIVSKRRSTTFDNIAERRSVTPMPEVMRETKSAIQTPIEKEINLTDNTNEGVVEVIATDHLSIVNTGENLNEHDEKDHDKSLHMQETVSTVVENVKTLKIQKKTPSEMSTTEYASIPIYNDLLENPKIDDKENCHNIVVSPLPDNFAKLKAKPPSPMRPSQRTIEKIPCAFTPPARSILTKQRDLISKEPCKSVKFSSKEDIVHNLCPDTPSPCNETVANNNDNSSTNQLNSKNIVKQTRAKSNVVVRRVVVSSKHD